MAAQRKVDVETFGGMGEPAATAAALRFRAPGASVACQRSSAAQHWRWEPPRPAGMAPPARPHALVPWLLPPPNMPCALCASPATPRCIGRGRRLTDVRPGLHAGVSRNRNYRYGRGRGRGYGGRVRCNGCGRGGDLELGAEHGMHVRQRWVPLPLRCDSAATPTDPAAAHQCCRAAAAAGAASSRAGSLCSRPEARAPPARRPRALGGEQRRLVRQLPGTKQARGPRSRPQQPLLLPVPPHLANAR